jgi:hypothetical protein
LRTTFFDSPIGNSENALGLQTHCATGVLRGQ